MKRAIITGATGAIGTALIEELISNNVEILILARKQSKRICNVATHPLVKIIECSMDGYQSLDRISDTDYDIFYHLAWEGTIGAERNDMYLQNRNVKHSLDAVNLAKRFGCKRFIGAGSQAEYGRFNGELTPFTPVFPEMGYGFAKLCAGQMTRGYANQIGIEHIWVRILSVYGPYDGSQSMVMSTINKFMNNEIPKLTKGEQEWDFLFSRDAAKALFLIGNHGINEKTYVLGNGTTKTIKEYVEIIRNIVAPDIVPDYGVIPYAEKQVMYLKSDISELKNETGWTPQTEFSDGIKEILKRYNNDA